MHAGNRGPRLRCLKRKPGWFGQGLVPIGTAHARIEERGLAVYVAVERALGDAERLSNVVHLRSPEHVGRAADELLDPFGGDEARHRLNYNRLNQSVKCLGSDFVVSNGLQLSSIIDIY